MNDPNSPFNLPSYRFDAHRSFVTKTDGEQSSTIAVHVDRQSSGTHQIGSAGLGSHDNQTGSNQRCRLNHQGKIVGVSVGEVVVVDGNRGVDLIDLRCYNVEDARFRDDMIEINGDSGHHFVVAHKNLRRAVFAGEVTVDL